MKKILFNILFICISVGFLYASDTLIVTQVDQEYLIAKSNLNKVPSQNQIYAVYTELTSVGDKKLPAGYIGEVYFLKNKEQELKFAYAWDSAYISIKKGFYLVPVGRAFNTEGINGNSNLNLIVEDSNKSTTAEADSSESSIMPGMPTPSSGKNGEKGLVSFRAGTGLSGGFPGADFGNFLFMLATLRAGVHGEVALNINETFSIGAQLGISALSMTVDNVDIYLLDFPARLTFNIDFGGGKLSALGGYYYALGLPPLSGIEVGGKLDLNGFYGQYTAVINEFIVISRIEAGYALSF